MHAESLSTGIATPSSDPEGATERLPPDWIFPIEDVRLQLGPSGSPVLLGRGGFGVVYLGRLRSVRPVAIKLFSDLNSTSHNRFAREIMILAAARDPGIVSFYGVSYFNGRLMLIMELMEGGSLHDALERNNDFHWYARYVRLHSFGLAVFECSRR